MAKQDEREKTIRFISKLVELTQDKKVNWEPASAPPNSEVAFDTEIEGKKLRIYRYSETIPNPDYAAYTSDRFGLSMLTISVGERRPPPPETIVERGIALLVIDRYGNQLYKFENRTGLSDLYESASYSAGRVDELIDSVLGKTPEETR